MRTLVRFYSWSGSEDANGIRVAAVIHDRTCGWSPVRSVGDRVRRQDGWWELFGAVAEARLAVIEHFGSPIPPRRFDEIREDPPCC